MTGAPIVTVGLPVFNGEDFLESSVRSILDQTLVDLELVILDNASDDATEDICRRLAGEDDRIRYYRNKSNIGASANYNKVFGLARGTYFKWAAHDDICHPKMLEMCVDALEACESDVVMAYPLGELIDEDGERLRAPLDQIASGDRRPHRRVAKLLRSLNLCDPIFGVHRTSALRNTQLIGPMCGADYVLLLELSLIGRFVQVDEVLFALRKHSDRSNSINKTTRARTAWYDPNAVKRLVVLPLWEQMVWASLKTIARSPLRGIEKVRTVLALLGVHYHRRARVFGGRQKALLKAKLRAPTSPSATNKPG